MNKTNSEKMKEEEKAVGKKSKRKKGARADEKEHHESEEKLDDAHEHSRSTSRGRSTLSSLFRKSEDANQRSRSRSKSREKSKAKSRGKDKGDSEAEAPPDINPRSDPREHYRRMTVREALKDSRARGRSPGRPTARLEQSILDLATEGQHDDLMSSAPHLSDILRDDEIDSARINTEHRSGSTLPRTKRHHRHRGRSAEAVSHKRSKTNDREHMLSLNLPLDKRKYMIDKDKVSSSNQEMSMTEKNATESHSIPKEPNSPTYAPSNYLEQEKSRRESFNQFLQLRDLKPNRYSSSSLSTGRDSITEEQFIYPEHNSEVSNAQLSNLPNIEGKYLAKLPSYEDAVAEKNKETESKTKINISNDTKDDSDSENEEFVDCFSSPTSPNAEIPATVKSAKPETLTRPETTSTHLKPKLEITNKSDIGIKTDISVKPESTTKPDIRKHIFFRNDSGSIRKPNSEVFDAFSNRNRVPIIEKQNVRHTNFDHDDAVSKVKESIVAQHVQPVNRQDSLRESYVSPRKFSRASKASVKSDKSEVSLISSDTPSSPVKTEISIENEIERKTLPNFRPKYQRHFSRKKGETDTKESKTPPDSIVHDKSENRQEITTEPQQHKHQEQQPQQQSNALILPPTIENKDAKKEDNITSTVASKDTNSNGGSDRDVSIQIGSKTYIAAVSAFKALLGRSKRANGAGNSPLVASKTISQTNTPLVKAKNSFEIPNEVKAEYVSKNNADIDCESDRERPIFRLSSENESENKTTINVKQPEDDEVFISVQEDTKETRKDSINHNENHETKTSVSAHEHLLDKSSLSQKVTPSIQPDDRHFRRISDRSSDSEEVERRNSLPIISNRLSQDSHSMLIANKEGARAKSDLDLSDRKEHVMKDEQTETDFDIKRHSLDSKSKGKKGKDKHKKKKVKGKAKKKSIELQKKEPKESNDPTIKSILKKQPETDKPNEEGQKKLKKVGSRGRLTREKRVEKPPLSAQRSTSLTDIRREKPEDKNRRPRKTKSTSHMRSRSHENISTLPHKAEKKPTKPSVDKGAAEGSSKPPAKLSISAIIALKSRLARMRKAKQKAAEPKVETEADHIEQTDENADASFTEGDKALIENEVNVSLGKLTVSTENDVIDDELENIYERKIKFDPYCTDDISEEELIKQRQRNTRLTSRRESKVRQRQKKVINCCKKFIAFMFSHIGLCSLMVGYSIAGGFIFQKLEAPYEIEKNNEMENLRKTILQNIWDLAFEVNYNKGSREVFKREVDAILKNYSQRIQRETKESGWDGDGGSFTGEEDDFTKQAKLWSFPSSLLFAITVMTTIGKITLYVVRVR